MGQGSPTSLDVALHHALVESLVDRGRVPSPADLARALDASLPSIAEALERLEANHAAVLHPTTREPWLVHPFSTTPTLFWVAPPDDDERGWWAPCIWCALGIASLVEGPLRISTTFAGRSRRCTIDVDGDALSPPGPVAHFATPLARAWDSVHHYCGCTLVFEDEAAVDPWCARHGLPRGEVLPLEKVAQLARVWYGGHLDPDWSKPSLDAARAIFASVGLTSPHWALPQGDERF